MWELIARVGNLESGLLHTFVQLMLRPGRVARSYVCGDQRSFVPPLSYLFLGAALQLGSLWITGDYLRANLARQWNASPATEAKQKLDDLFDGRAGEAMGEAYLASVQQAYVYAALLFFCLPFGTCLYLLHRLAGERFRLAETMIFAFYCFGQTLALTAVGSLLCHRYTTVQMTMAIVVYTAVPLWAHGDFFRRSWLSRSFTLLATLVATAIFLLSIVGIFMVSVATMVVRVKMG